jgi:hypothetical protein
LEDRVKFNKQPMIADLRIYEVRRVSREHGRACLKELETAGRVSPQRTPTGRTYLSFDDAKALADAL